MLRILLIVLLGLQCQQRMSTEQNPLKDAKRILFLGNSITYAGAYVSYIEAYWTLRHPGIQGEFINLGLSSETVSGLSEPSHANGKFPRPDLRERLNRALTQIEPDVVFACYGMNDGIYLPFDEERFVKFKEGIRHLNEQVANAGAEIIYLTPPVYDPLVGEAYANVLDLYADWLISQRYTADWQVIDVHWPMQRSLDNAREADPTFTYAKDGIHPNPQGHWVMAREVLAYLGEQEVATIPEADSAFAAFPHGQEVLRLVKARQAIVKHAYLSAVGHERPGVTAGLPLPEAKQQADSLDREIRKLLKGEGG